MTDEQPVPIYLSPEEELTSVRERLEKTQARRIILVIPPQTQLRSHVGWRLIHARMRELGKDLLVISPDRQVRAVARAAGFRVAESQESPSSRPRPGSSGTRPGSMNTRGAARSRISSNRGGPDSRASHQGGARRQTLSSNRPLTPLPPPEREDYEDEVTLERSGPQPSEPQEKPIAPPVTLFKEPEVPSRLPGSIHISTTPSVRPSVPGHVDDDNDVDKYYEDYNTARRIRESASGKSESTEQERYAGERERESRGAPSRKWGHDPFIYMEDEPPPLSLPEQKGSMPGLFEEIGTNVPDLSDRSTEIMQSEIEDQGDLGAITPPEITSLPKQTPAMREQSARTPQTRGQSRQHSPRAPRPGSPGIDDDDELLAIPDRPTRAERPSREIAGGARRPSQAFNRPAQENPRPSQALKPGQAAQPQRPSQALKFNQPAQAAQPQRSSQALKPGATGQAAQRSSRSLRSGQLQGGQRSRSSSAVGTRTPVLPQSPQARQPISRQRVSRRSGGRGLGIFVATVVVLLVVLGLLFYFVPTATVTISLQAQNFTQNVQLNATANPQANTPGHIQAQLLEHDFSVSDQGHASGQTKVGNASAQGLVTFTNNGTTDVTIPTNTIVTTQSGISFATTAEAFVSHGQSQPAVPVSAQQTGVAGNVPGNSINSIPSASVNSIAQYNHTSASAINLSVTNPQATSGGGVKNEPAVTQQDLQALKRSLHQKLQQQIGAWLTAQKHPGDQFGTPVPDAQASANPLPEEQFSGAPGAGTAEDNGTFSGTLTLHVKVLFASAAAIKAAAGAVLNAAAQQLHPASMLATQLPITLASETSKPAKDGNSMTISAKATGAVIKQISLQDISASLAGKSVGQASSDLKNSMASIQNVQVNLTPSFLGIMPLRADRIQVILQPVQTTPPNHVSNS
jgi:hypothetical protein